MTAAAVEYDRAIKIVRGDDVDARIVLAANPRTPPEFLYYLSEDTDVRVRRAVGENPATPNKADINLSKDDDISVRCAVARKIVGDGLDANARRDMWRMGFTILETLMRDNVVKVRQILTQAFKSDPQAPREMVLGLARDREETVAAPVLRESPVLTDEDVVSIIEEGAQSWAHAAVAERESLSSAVAETLIKHGDTPAVAKVIGNPRSALSSTVLESLVERSEGTTELQPPLVERKDVPGKLLTRLAKFVSQPLLKTLCGRKDLDQQAAGAINQAIEGRADKPAVRAAPARSSRKGADARSVTAKAANSKASNAKTSKAKAGGAATPEAKARQMFETGKLTDEVVAAALDRWEANFVIQALALRASIPIVKVRRMVRVKSARTMVALAWKAGFTARFAMDLQRQLANILPTKIINARDGIDFALTTAEMENQLALFD